MKVLFLDDNINRIEVFKLNFLGKQTDTIIAVKTAKECIDWLNYEDFHFLFLDHDLGDEVFVDSNRVDCGMEVVRFLENNHKDIKKIYLHSCNDPARRTMFFKLGMAGYNVTESKFTDIDWKNIYDILYGNLKIINKNV